LAEDIVVVGVGNELLDGRTVNTNLAWLGKRLEDEGYSIARSVILRDDVNELSRRISEIIRDKPRVLILTGGLGPTWDDITLQGLARALHAKLVLSRSALRMIRSRIRGKLTAERKKMAFLPEGSRPLKNNKGTAPGVYVRKGSMRIVALPGVPEEMMDLFDRQVLRVIKGGLRREVRATGRMTVRGIPEADLAPMIGKVKDAISGVYIKSHVRYSEVGLSPIEVFFSSRGKRPASDVEEALSSLGALVTAAGGTTKIRSSPPSSAQ